MRFPKESQCPIFLCIFWKFRSKEGMGLGEGTREKKILGYYVLLSSALDLRSESS
jgi:hypothetical protein